LDWQTPFGARLNRGANADPTSFWVNRLIYLATNKLDK
tara:strand:+ start:716 stop:829 length:114 start_codon:yes stop_codon:yes gene_type:complete